MITACGRSRRAAAGDPRRRVSSGARPRPHRIHLGDAGERSRSLRDFRRCLRPISPAPMTPIVFFMSCILLPEFWRLSVESARIPPLLASDRRLPRHGPRRCAPAYPGPAWHLDAEEGARGALRSPSGSALSRRQPSSRASATMSSSVVGASAPASQICAARRHSADIGQVRWIAARTIEMQRVDQDGAVRLVGARTMAWAWGRAPTSRQRMNSRSTRRPNARRGRRVRRNAPSAAPVAIVARYGYRGRAELGAGLEHPARHARRFRASAG